MQVNVRNPIVAGRFYPAAVEELKQQICGFIDPKAKKQDVLACLLPHAGYIYSGFVACQTLSRIQIKPNILLLGPNHTGLGERFSIMTGGSWKTPLGQIKINVELANAILKRSKLLKEDSLAHRDEHSLEVQLPLLQYFKVNFTIVPIAFLSNEVQALKDIGQEIAQAIRDLKIDKDTLVVASSDMTHYEPQANAQKKDRAAIDAILALDEDRLVKNIQELDISMCGYAPAVAMLSLAKALGAKEAELVKYQTSGDVTQDYSSVVGYAGIIIY